jgi:ubiquinol-cytochrome c reductase subunit 7
MRVVYRLDDLIPEENEVVQLAIRRLPPKEAYDRIFRLRRAFQVGGNQELSSIPSNTVQLSLSHHLLPKHEQTKPEEVRLFYFLF